MKPVKDRIWNEYGQIDAEETSPGVVRKILAYTDEVMIVENHFEVGAVGALHHHPHTQITYIISGAFEFEINGEKRIVRAGDSLLKKMALSMAASAWKKGFFWMFLRQCVKTL